MIVLKSHFLSCFFLQNQVIIFSGFIVFEVCVGIFWPAFGMMRGKYVPEASGFLFIVYCLLITITVTI